MFSEIFPDPNLMFRFKIDLQRLAKMDSITAFDDWRFEDQHRMPPIDRFTFNRSPLPVHLGWNPQGLFFQFLFSGIPPIEHFIRSNRLRIRVGVNSRYNPNLLRENEFCTSFIFICPGPNVPQLSTDRSRGVEPMFVIKPGAASKSSEPVGVDPRSAGGWIRSESEGIACWIFIGAESMQGYRPEEFPDIGLFFDACWIESDIDGRGDVWSMVYSYNDSSRGNPSLWPQCRLV